MTLEEIINLDDRLDHYAGVLAELEGEYAAEKSEEKRDLLSEKIADIQCRVMILRHRLTHVYDDMFC